MCVPIKMPYRRHGKYKRSGRRSYGRAHHSAARSIARAWRVRKRRKSSLLTRTALSNRRRIKKLSRDVETKFVQNTIANVNNAWASGLCCGGVTPDETGQWVDYQQPPVGGLYPNGAFACDLLQLTQGVASDQRVGAWVQMKSLTLKYSITSDSKTPLTTFGVLLVHDSNPSQGGQSLGEVLERTGGVPLISQANAIGMAFLKESNFGKEGRFKILKHIKHKIGGYGKNVAGVTVPAIATAQAGGGTGTTYGNVTRPAYLPYNTASAMKGAPLAVHGSVTLRTPYKVNYGDAPSTFPKNQSIFLMAYQYMDGPFSQPGQTGGSKCYMQWRGRYRFKDA